MLYDEPHPLGDDIGTIQTADLARRPDMLIIMGTSLKVHGFKKLVKEFARAVHESAPPKVNTLNPTKKSSAKSHAGKVIFVNKTPPGAEWEGIIDIWVQGESDNWVEKVVDDWKKAVPGDWEVQQKLDGVPTSGGPFKVMKELNGAGLKGKGKGNENIPPDVISLACLTPLPDSPPPSPSKRRMLTCHYMPDEEGECSASKKRASSRLGRDEGDIDDLPGLLFGNCANKRTVKKEEVEDVFPAASDVRERSRPKGRTGTKGGGAAKGGAAKGGAARARSVSRPKAASAVQKGKGNVATQSRRARAGTKVK